MDPAPALLLDKPAAKAAYEKLFTFLLTLGPFSVEEKKTSLHLVAGGAAFLGVHPRRNGLRINIVLSRPLDTAVRSERVSARRVHNEFDFSVDEDVSEELASWLREAYELKLSSSPTNVEASQESL